MLHKLGVQSIRTKNIVKHIGWSFIYKGGTILFNFLTVPLTINFLDNENYGIWLILSSFMSWFSFFDIGLGNGLRNKFAEAKSLGYDDRAQSLVSSAYFTIATISLVLFFLFYVINYFVDWTEVFNTSPQLLGQLQILMPILFGFFGIQLVAKLITTIYTADQHHSIQGKVQFYIQLISLLVIWLLTVFSNSSLLTFGIIFSALPSLILFGVNLFAFSSRYRRYRPRLSLWRWDDVKDISGLGFKFFVIQIAALVLFSTDNFIIARLFSPEEVVPYNISYRYFSILTMVYTIMISPYWSSFTEAYTNNDFEWIKRSVNNIQKIWFAIPFILILMVFISDWFYLIWIGEKVYVPTSLSLAMALFVLLSTFNMVYVNFINGVGKIKLQLVTSVITIILNIPLSIFFAKNLGLGTTGVTLATCFCLGYSVILRPMQYFKIVNNTATGIWDK
nr:lipopolysaccharide biosynthesis protein [Lunatimonas salinarum]